MRRRRKRREKSASLFNAEILKGDALPAAQKQFRNLGMQKTKERNAVLIFVAPRARKFAVIGDDGVHQKCGEEYWTQLVEFDARTFSKGGFHAGAVGSD